MITITFTVIPAPVIGFIILLAILIWCFWNIQHRIGQEQARQRKEQITNLRKRWEARQQALAWLETALKAQHP